MHLTKNRQVMLESLKLMAVSVDVEAAAKLLFTAL